MRSATDRNDAPAGILRLDRWLWHARFYRTRALAATAIEAGHVRLNGERTKPARAVRAGDVIAVSRAGLAQEVTVLSLPVRRGPASEARLAYAETPDSIARGLRHAENQRLGAFAAPRPPGRPDKKARRQLRALDRRQTEPGPAVASDGEPHYDGDERGEADES